MREYGTVSPQFWIGPTGKQLRGHTEAQIVALYLMTSPHSTMTGVFHCPMIYISHETGLPMEGALKGLARLFEVGFCEYEDASELVFVTRMAAYQVGEELKPGDNRILGLKRELAKMPESSMKQRFLQVYGSAYKLLESSVEQQAVVSPLQAPSKPLPSQDQDQEQDQEQERERARKPRPAKRCPAEFQITDELKAWAMQNAPRVDLARETADFLDHEFKNAHTDWPATWRRWMRTAEKNLNGKTRQTAELASPIRMFPRSA